MLVGRGKAVSMHHGNRQFQNIIMSELENYASAQSKRGKGLVILRVIERVREMGCGEGFVKKDVTTGQWYSLDNKAARIIVSQAFR